MASKLGDLAFLNKIGRESASKSREITIYGVDLTGMLTLILLLEREVLQVV